MTSYLIETAQPLAYTNTTNATELALVMATVQLLAIASHPTISQLFYSLYGVITNTTFSSYVLQTTSVNSNGQESVQNVTLTVSLNC